MNKKDKYVNAGVLLINLAVWREKKLQSNFMQYLEENNYSLPQNDQDVINHVCKGHIGILPMCYNVITTFLNYNTQQIMKLCELSSFYSEQERIKAISAPVIIHYASVNQLDRPWFFECEHVMKNRFDYYVECSGIDFIYKHVKLTKTERFYRFLRKHLSFSFFLLLKKIQNRNSI